MWHYPIWAGFIIVTGDKILICAFHEVAIFGKMHSMSFHL